MSATATQYIMSRELSSAIVYFESSLAGTPSFWFEQLSGVMAIPAHNLNGDWEAEILSRSSATKLFKNFLPGTTLPFPSDAGTLTKAELVAGLAAVGAASAINASSLSPRGWVQPALLTELRHAIAVARVQRDIAEGTDAGEMSIVRKLLVA